MSLLTMGKTTLNRDVAIKPRLGRVATPLKLYLIMLAAVFILHTLEAWYTPIFLPFNIHLPYRYYDPFFTTLCIAPVLWWLLIRPLQVAVNDGSVKYEAVKSQVVDAVVTIDMQGIIISFNPAAERIFGYSPEEISGKNAAGLFCDASLAASNLQLLAGEDKVQLALIHEVTCHRRDGQPLRLEISVSRLLLDGTPQFLVIMRDITTRIKLEQDALEIQSRLIQANKMTALGLMVSGVAHEINNPNNYILSNAQLMERSCSDIIKVLREYQQENGDFLIGGLPFAKMEQHFPEMISGIISGTQRINGIINDLKAFARQGCGVHLEEIDLNLAINAALLIVKSQVNRHTQNFTTQLAENLPKIIGNSQQIGQVVINLLMNACQALPDEAAAIRLETCLDSDSSEAVISITDAGEGIPEDIVKRVMEPFFSTRGDSGGTGLGLSICDSIIKEHSGSLTFKSEQGVGTTFQIRFPVVKQPLPEAP